MKVTLIASVSANGKVLLANNPNHQIAPEVMGFLVQKAIESGNIVFGYSTYTMFIDALQDALAGKEIVVLSNNHVNPEKPYVPLNKNDAFQKVQKRRVQKKR